MEAKAINYKSIYYPPGGILIWIIIFLELITFGMGLFAFAFYSREDPGLFHSSRLALNKTIGVINTLLLLTSGFCMAETIKCVKKNNLKKAALFLKLTNLGGILFIVLKATEYYQKITAGISISTNLFYTYYWLLTAFHLVHVITGLVILAFVFAGITKNKATINIENMEASAAFWHMCDLIWLLLFPVFYLLL
ncbi:MAG: cytochrome c oxidase subunit 3 [Sediminibacterium sp.]|nr:cytochrome c oxidase subunit 3 [Sediminibacterium sp.]TXT33017.1 MAG: nitric oxide reductase NorE protein [Chitinophagaceae bacterium]